MKEGERPSEAGVKFSCTEVLVMVILIAATYAVAILICSAVDSHLDDAVMAMIFLAFPCVIGIGLYAAWNEEQQEKAKWRKLWSELESHPQLAGAEIEHQNREGVSRGPVSGIEVKGARVTIDREWLAVRKDGEWTPFDPPKGLPLKIGYDSGIYPTEREDGTILILSPRGSVVIYLADHPDLLSLQKTVTLEPALEHQPAEQPIS